MLIALYALRRLYPHRAAPVAGLAEVVRIAVQGLLQGARGGAQLAAVIAMIELGVPVLAAHMFVFFFANVSALTPPVAVSALVAANISGGRFLPTAMLSVQLGLPGFLLPFLCVARPEILGIGAGLGEQALVAAVALVAVVALNMAIEGHMMRPLLPAAFGPAGTGLAQHRGRLGAAAGRAAPVPAARASIRPADALASARQTGGNRGGRTA